MCEGKNMGIMTTLKKTYPRRIPSPSLLAPSQTTNPPGGFQGPQLLAISAGEKKYLPMPPVPGSYLSRATWRCPVPFAPWDQQALYLRARRSPAIMNIHRRNPVAGDMAKCLETSPGQFRYNKRSKPGVMCYTRMAGQVKKRR